MFCQISLEYWNRNWHLWGSNGKETDWMLGYIFHKKKHLYNIIASAWMHVTASTCAQVHEDYSGNKTIHFSNIILSVHAHFNVFILQSCCISNQGLLYLFFICIFNIYMYIIMYLFRHIQIQQTTGQKMCSNSSTSLTWCLMMSPDSQWTSIPASSKPPN